MPFPRASQCEIGPEIESVYPSLVGAFLLTRERAGYLIWRLKTVRGEVHEPRLRKGTPGVFILEQEIWPRARGLASNRSCGTGDLRKRFRRRLSTQAEVLEEIGKTMELGTESVVRDNKQDPCAHVARGWPVPQSLFLIAADFTANTPLRFGQNPARRCAPIYSLQYTPAD